jgi:hypothetical protein
MRVVSDRPPVLALRASRGARVGTMSRYVTIEIDLGSLVEIRGDLEALDIVVEATGRRSMLSDSLECAGEPVDLRIAAGPFGTVADFGFVEHERRIGLVCSDLDRDLLEAHLLGPLRLRAAERALHRCAEATELETEVDRAGQRIIIRARNR